MIARNLFRGIGLGIAGSILYSLIAILIYVISGQDAFAAHHTTLLATVGAYWMGGLGAGLILGLLWPLGRWTWGAGLIGFLCAVVVWLGIAVASDGRDAFDTGNLILILVLAVVFGPAGGIVARRRWRAEM